MNNGCDKGLCISERRGGDRDMSYIEVWMERQRNQSTRANVLISA